MMNIINCSADLGGIYTVFVSSAVRLSANAHIKGFMLQAKSGAKLPHPKKTRGIPLDTIRGPCDDTVSHR